MNNEPSLDDQFRRMLEARSIKDELAEILEDYICEELPLVLVDHFRTALEEVFMLNFFSDIQNNVVRKVEREIKDELIQPLRRQVFRDHEAIKADLRKEFAAAVREELRLELYDSVRQELRDELVAKFNAISNTEIERDEDDKALPAVS